MHQVSAHAAVPILEYRITHKEMMWYKINCLIASVWRGFVSYDIPSDDIVGN